MVRIPGEREVPASLKELPHCAACSWSVQSSLRLIWNLISGVD